jgi:hypothetical protein
VELASLPSDGPLGRGEHPGGEGDQELVIAPEEPPASTLDGRDGTGCERTLPRNPTLVHLDAHPARLGQEARSVREAVRCIEHRVGPPYERLPLGDTRVHLEHADERASVKA